MKDRSIFIVLGKYKYVTAILCVSILTLGVTLWTLGHRQLLAGFEVPAPTSSAPVRMQSSEVRNIILISWDGVDRSTIKELLAREKVPNLAHLLQEGSFQEIEVRGHATVTKPGHAEMLTGLSADVTGVYGNLHGTYRPIPEGYTIFEHLQTYLGKDSIATIFVAGKKANLGGRGPGVVPLAKRPATTSKHSQGGHLPEGADDIPTMEIEGEPFFLTKKHLDVFDVEQRDADIVGPLCLRYLKQYKAMRFFAFLHFSDPDHAGHLHGSDSSQYRQAMVDCDKWLGRIILWLKQENLYGSTLIYVTTDHGFDLHARDHNNAPHSWLVTNDKCVGKGGIIADIAATILVRFGVDLAKLTTPLLGKPL
jgi:predicted AlkP superfamily pyrophosphatase or phosphodiesterase